MCGRGGGGGGGEGQTIVQLPVLNVSSVPTMMPWLDTLNWVKSCSRKLVDRLQSDCKSLLVATRKTTMRC